MAKMLAGFVPVVRSIPGYSLEIPIGLVDRSRLVSLSGLIELSRVAAFYGLAALSRLNMRP